MNSQKLIETATAMVSPGKGLLTMDESNPTCNKRFATAWISQTIEARRAYRELGSLCHALSVGGLVPVVEPEPCHPIRDLRHTLRTFAEPARPAQEAMKTAIRYRKKRFQDRKKERSRTPFFSSLD
jgi:hypothetical protein